MLTVADDDAISEIEFFAENFVDEIWVGVASAEFMSKDISAT